MKFDCHLKFKCYEMHVAIIMVIISYTLNKDQEVVAGCVKVPKGFTDRTSLRNTGFGEDPDLTEVYCRSLLRGAPETKMT